MISRDCKLDLLGGGRLTRNCNNLNKYDILKAFAVVLVVIGHITILYTPANHPNVYTKPLEILTLLIYLFHMPLFMSLSGSIYQIGIQRGKYNLFLPFLRNKAYRLLMPYLCVGIVFLLPTLVLINEELTYSSITLYSKIIYATDNRHLWYLLALFWIFLFQFTADSCGLPRWLTFCIALIISTLLSIVGWFKFFDLANAFRYWPYFIFGTMIESNFGILKFRISAIIALLGAALSGICYYAFPNTVIGQILIILFPCFIIMFFDLCAGEIINKAHLPLIISVLIEYSFGIYLFHVSVIYIIHHYLGNVNCYVIIPVMFVLGLIIPIFITFLLRAIKLHYFLGE